MPGPIVGGAELSTFGNKIFVAFVATAAICSMAVGVLKLSDGRYVTRAQEERQNGSEKVYDLAEYREATNAAPGFGLEVRSTPAIVWDARAEISIAQAIQDHLANLPPPDDSVFAADLRDWSDRLLLNGRADLAALWAAGVPVQLGS